MVEGRARGEDPYHEGDRRDYGLSPGRGQRRDATGAQHPHRVKSSSSAIEDFKVVEDVPQAVLPLGDGLDLVERVVLQVKCGSPEIVEGSLCRVSGEGGGLVVDR